MIMDPAQLAASDGINPNLASSIGCCPPFTTATTAPYCGPCKNDPYNINLPNQNWPYGSVEIHAGSEKVNVSAHYLPTSGLMSPSCSDFATMCIGTPPICRALGPSVVINFKPQNGQSVAFGVYFPSYQNTCILPDVFGSGAYPFFYDWHEAFIAYFFDATTEFSMPSHLKGYTWPNSGNYPPQLGEIPLIVYPVQCESALCHQVLITATIHYKDKIKSVVYSGFNVSVENPGQDVNRSSS
jgi:hypothetical protein